jgi:hypothetical protein
MSVSLSCTQPRMQSATLEEVPPASNALPLIRAPSSAAASSGGWSLVSVLGVAAFASAAFFAGLAVGRRGKAVAAEYDPLE